MEYLNYVNNLLSAAPHLQVVVSHTFHDSLVDIDIVDIDGTHNTTTITEIRNLFSLQQSDKINFPDTGTRCLLVEDLSPVVIDCLGKTFDLDPAFFADHLRNSLYPVDLLDLVDPITGSPYQFSSLDYHGKPYFSIRWHRLGTKDPQTLASNKQFLQPYNNGNEANVVRPCQDLYVSGGPDGFCEDFKIAINTGNRLMVAPAETVSVYRLKRSNQDLMIVLFDPAPSAVAKTDVPGSQVPLLRSASTIETPYRFSETMKTPAIKPTLPSNTSRRRVEVIFGMSQNHSCTKLVNIIFNIIFADWLEVLSQRAPLLDLIDIYKVDNDIVQERITQWRRILGFWARDLGHNAGLVGYALAILKTQSRKKGIFETDDELEHASLPIEVFLRLEKAVKNLKERTDNTMTSLMASMSIIESQKAILQTERVSRITELAFFFIPISFVASIYGTNITELNGKFTFASWGAVTLGMLVTTYFVRLLVHLQHKHHKRAVQLKNRPTMPNNAVNVQAFGFTKYLTAILASFIAVIVAVVALVPSILLTEQAQSTPQPSMSISTITTVFISTMTTISTATSDVLTTTSPESFAAPSMFSTGTIITSIRSTVISSTFTTTIISGSSATSEGTPLAKSSRHPHLVPILVGSIIGFVVLCLLVALEVFRHRASRRAQTNGVCSAPQVYSVEAPVQAYDDNNNSQLQTLGPHTDDDKNQFRIETYTDSLATEEMKQRRHANQDLIVNYLAPLA